LTLSHIRETLKKAELDILFIVCSYFLSNQGRMEVTRRPGQEASLAPPCSKLRSYGSKFTVFKKVFVTLLGFVGLFSAPPADIWRPGNCAPLIPPSLRSWL